MKERETLKAVASYAIFTWMLKLNVILLDQQILYKSRQTLELPQLICLWPW